MIINFERAWIVLELIETYEANRQIFRCVLTNYGRSPAHITGCNIYHSFAMTLDALPADPAAYYENEFIQPLLVPEEEWEFHRFPMDVQTRLPKTVTVQPCL